MRDFVIEDGTELDVGRMKIGKGTVIKKGCRICCKELDVGNDVLIECGTNISSFRGQRADKVIIGDNCYIGREVNFALPLLEMGDFVTAHKHVGIFGEMPGVIGHNCWIGEGAILNTCGFLYLGNNVGIGARSHTWTHVGHGELLEGCLLYIDKPVVIEDDAWLVDGQITITPGVIIRRKSCILPGSVVTKNTAESHCYAGAPAKDLTDKVKPYKEISLDEKFSLMQRFLREFMASKEGEGYRTSVLDEDRHAIEGMGSFYLVKIWNRAASEKLLKGKGPHVVVCLDDKLSSDVTDVSVFEIRSKQYVKKRTIAEIEFMKFMRGYRARFVPGNRPRIGIELLRQYCPDYSNT